MTSLLSISIYLAGQNIANIKTVQFKFNSVIEKSLCKDDYFGTASAKLQPLE